MRSLLIVVVALTFFGLTFSGEIGSIATSISTGAVQMGATFDKLPN